MPPVRIIPLVRVPLLRSRSRSSTICVIWVQVIPHNARQWDIVRDMCRVCAMNQAEETAQRRACLVAQAEDEEERIESGLTILID